MSAPYHLDAEGRPLACPECRGHGYVVDLIGEIRVCTREECVRKRAVEILEEGHGGAKGADVKDLFPGLSGMLKGNTEFRKLAGSFVMGGIAGVVAKMGSDLLTEAAKKGELKDLKLYDPGPPFLGPPPGAAKRAKKKPSRRKSR